MSNLQILVHEAMDLETFSVNPMLALSVFAFSHRRQKWRTTTEASQYRLPQSLNDMLRLLPDVSTSSRYHLTFHVHVFSNESIQHSLQVYRTNVREPVTDNDKASC